MRRGAERGSADSRSRSINFWQFPETAKGYSFLTHAAAVSRRCGVIDAGAVQMETSFCTALIQRRRILHLLCGLFENSGKYRIHIAQVPVQVKRLFESSPVQKNFDSRIGDDALAKI